VPKCGLSDQFTVQPLAQVWGDDASVRPTFLRVSHRDSPGTGSCTLCARLSESASWFSVSALVGEQAKACVFSFASGLEKEELR
jgi:hypothetical protein